MKYLLTILSAALLLWSCGGNSNSNSTFEKVETETPAEAVSETAEAVTETQEAVCILNNLPLRATPADKGKWLTGINLGEVVTFLGEEKADSVSKKVYYKIQLTGGKEGWSRADFIEIGGKVGVFIQDTEVYKRPDLLTKANKKYSQMDIIAVVSTQGDWSEVKGKRGEGKYIESGWVKGANISDKTVDIATAKFGVEALAKEGAEQQIEALKEVISNTDLANSVFIPILQEKLNESIADDEEIVEEIVDSMNDSTGS